MAQKRLRDWKDDLGSFEHNIINLGLKPPGRYVGFDTLVGTNPGVDLEFEIRHTATGASYKNQINNVIGPHGVYVTAQGVIVLEDAPIVLSVDDNAANASIRYDLIYVDHTYTQVVGGQDATYHVLKGALGNPIKPVLTDPLKQVALGIIEIPPGSNDVANFIWHKAKCPDSGDGEDARLHTPNVFKAIQFQNANANSYVPTDQILTGAYYERLYMFPNTANVFRILPPDAANAKTLDAIFVKDVELQEGARIYVHINEHVTLRESILWKGTAAMVAKGYKEFLIPPGLGNTNVGNAGGAGVWGVKPDAGEQWELEFLYISGKWRLISIGGAGGGSGFRRGDTIMWFGDVLANFDATGLGQNLKLGWALCNGNNQTPDMRGKGPVMATIGVPSAGRPDLTDDASIIAAGLDPTDYHLSAVLATAGKKQHVLTQADLPSVQFPTNDAGHQHLIFGNNEVGAISNLTYPARQHGTGGNSGYEMWGSNSVPTTGLTRDATSGLTVYSGGSSQPIPLMQPVMSTVFIMKL